MRIAARLLLTTGLMTLAGIACSPPPDVGPSPPANPPGAGQHTGETDLDAIRVAVVTGGHAFDVPNFYQLFRRLPGIDAYPQHLEHFASSPEETRDAYDVVLFYGMDQGVPEEEGRRAAGNPRAAIQRIVQQGQGVLILHHALLAWEKWDVWNQLIGFDNRNFRYKEGLKLDIQVDDEEHPVTEGLKAFKIVDEGYVLHGEYDGQGPVLLTVQHEDAMHQVAWAREQDGARVFCLTLGHDDQSWTNAGFQEVLRRAIAWCAEEGSR